ncbi:spin [Symbiodinium microadriaticum]|nr:spin [Symbiodinium microadriaticum]
MEELAVLFTAVVSSQLALDSWLVFDFVRSGGDYKLIFSIVHTISAPAAGLLARHVPRNMLILVASLAISVGLSTCALSYFLSSWMTVFLLVLSSLGFGVGSGLMQPLLWSLVMEKSEAKRRGAAFGFLHAMTVFSGVLQSQNPFLHVQKLIWVWPLAASGFNILTGAMCALKVTDSSVKSEPNLPMILGRRTFWVLAVPAGLLKASIPALTAQIVNYYNWFHPWYFDRSVVFIYHGLGQVISAVVGGVALDGIDSNSPVTGPPSATAILPIIVISVGRAKGSTQLLRLFGAYIYLYSLYLAVVDIIYLVVHYGMGWWDQSRPGINVIASHIKLAILLTVMTVPIFFDYPEDRQVVARAVQMAEADGAGTEEPAAETVEPAEPAP